MSDPTKLPTQLRVVFDVLDTDQIGHPFTREIVITVPWHRDLSKAKAKAKRQASKGLAPWEKLKLASFGEMD